MIYNLQMECMDRPALCRLQAERLGETLQRVAALPFYVARGMGELAAGAVGRPAGPAGALLEHLERLPFTTKQDLRDQYPFGLFAVPQRDLARVHATSGTRGKPTLVGYTKNDLATWAELCARLLAGAGARPGDTLHVALNYGLFTGGLGIHGGAERLGCLVVPASAGSTHRQLLLMNDLRPVGLKATPSYALHLAEVAEQEGIDPRSFGLRYGIFGAEPWSEAVRARLEERFGFLAYDSYGLSEMLGPGVAWECEHRNGLHLAEDHFLPEIIDPMTGHRLPPGEEGELVLTSLTKEAYPLIRFRTGDRTVMLPDPCPCGRTHIRIDRIRGRVDEMLIIRGVNLFPTEVERVLLSFPELHHRYQVRLWRHGALDEAEVLVEPRRPQETDEAALARRLKAAIKQELGVAMGVRVATIPDGEGRNKALRVIDERSGVS
ncbi:MAG: Phenylacetate--CoA ligase [Symbiobacteriaceae bacterium]|jgi:phenylacetate-CoA ligase|nr:Phenylacetate--CoA ligase [Symbiobacteriaceae bacterium]